MKIQFPPVRVEMLRGSTEIAEYVKEDPKHIPDLVQTESLPAWKRNGKGPWRALGFELQNWMIRQHKKYFTPQK